MDTSSSGQTHSAYGGDGDHSGGHGRERVSSGDAPALASGGKSLKRGSACLFCRKRKLRCTGTKPCPVCVKHGMECTFDDPVISAKSRVSQLEEKIAGLEEILSAQMEGGKPSKRSARHSQGEQPQRERASSFPYPPQRPTAISPPPTTHLDQQQIEFSLALQELLRHNPAIAIPGQDALSFSPSVDARAELPHPHNDPTSPDYFAAYGRFAPLTTHHQAEQPTQVSTGDAVSSESLWDAAGETALADPSVPFIDPSLDLSSLFVSASPSFSNFGLFGAPPLPGGLPGFDFLATPSTAPEAVPFWSPNSDHQPSGGPGVNNAVDWGDGTILPDGMRYHLLGLFIQRRRQFAWVAHVGRFLASLDGPPEGRPAPALLFAMYASVARFSPHPHVQALEETFYDLTRRKLDEGIALYGDQRVIQLVQASVVLSVFCYSKAKYLEGWMQGGASIRLAQSCRLHRLSSKEIAYDMQCFADGSTVPMDYRSGYPIVCCPPKDAIELGERVWAFWSAVLLDQIGAIAVGRPLAQPFAEIETPLPRTLDEFEQGTISMVYDRPVYALPSIAPPRHPSDPLGGILFEAIMLLAAVRNLADHFVVPSLRDDHLARPFVPGGLSPTSSTTGSSPASTASPRGSTSSGGQSAANSSSPTSTTDQARPLPEEYRQAAEALVRFVDELPPQYRDPSRTWVGGVPPWHSDHGLPSDQGTFDAPSSDNAKVGVHPVIFSLHVVLCTAFMLLYTSSSPFSPHLYRPKALRAARSAVQLIHLVAEIDFGQLDIYLIVFWRIQARTMLEEIKLLREEGQTEKAEGLVGDIDVLVLAMKRMGELWSYGRDLAERVQTGDA